MQKDEQTTEVRESQEQVGNTTVQRQTVEKQTSVPGAVTARRIVYYIGGVIVAILFVRFILQLLGANPGSDFVGFMYGLSGFFAAPFFGILGEPTFGASQFETSTLVAIIVYSLITIGIAKLIDLTQARDQA